MWLTWEMVGATPSNPVVSIRSDWVNQVWLVWSNVSNILSDISSNISSDHTYPIYSKLHCIVEYISILSCCWCWLWELDATIAIRGNLNESKWWDDIANDKGGDNEADLGCNDHNKGVAKLYENATNKNQKELCSTLMMMILIKMVTLMLILMTITTSMEPIWASLGKVANNRVVPPSIKDSTAILTHHWNKEIWKATN